MSLLGDGIHGTPLYNLKGSRYFINGTNIKNNQIIITDKTKLVSEEESLKHSRCLSNNTILVSINGTLGNVAYYKGENVILGKSVCYFNLLGVYKYYIGVFLKSFYIQKYLKVSATGSTIKNVPLSAMRSMLVPIPPLGEQKRIVTKIEQILPYINEYESSESKIVQLNNEFPNKLKRSILQEAVQGKLVPQDPSDEPASILLERIREEKARLIKEGKIKKDKNESVIFRRDNSYYEKSNGVERCIDKELPFEIPNSWEWTRFKNIIIDDKGGGTPDKSNSKYWGGTIPWMSVKDFSKAKNGIIIDTIDHITQEGVNCSSTNVIDSEAIILCTRMGLGKYAKLSRPTAINQDLRAIWLTPNICEKYFLYFYRTLNIVGSGVTVKGIKREDLLETLIPIPPIQEQNRIIRTIDSMIELCNKL